VRQDWEPEDLVAVWTLVENDWALVANKAGATRLGFALLLKFFEVEAGRSRRAACCGGRLRGEASERRPGRVRRI